MTCVVLYVFLEVVDEDFRSMRQGEHNVNPQPKYMYLCPCDTYKLITSKMVLILCVYVSEISTSIIRTDPG